MSQVLKIMLDPARAEHLKQMSEMLRVTPEVALELALNLVLAEWREMLPELRDYKPNRSVLMVH
ncbi:hypothetical protein LJR219_004339 [Phenylobacterium sp. LjRoot219]|uniref:hypothetical protein n=1 Tax=Phenylobacterium sp. LjRoot219 TaxID=3342283 RepID=UPI003ECF7025